MRVSVAGTGYVGLVTGVCLAEIGHRVTCVDIDEQKIAKLTQGISPIYEPGLEDLMKKNHEAGRLDFSTDSAQAYGESDVIFIAVGTPENEDGSATITVTMDYDTILVFAKKGLLAALTEAANEVLEENVPNGKEN